MAYKILGQTVSVAPSTSAVTNLNLIKDPSFSATAGTSAVNTQANTTTVNATQAFNNSSTWFYTNTATTGMYLTSATDRGVTAAFGGSNSAIGFNFTGGGSHSAYIGYGYAAGSQPLYNTSAGSNTFSAANAIPVTAGTAYYYGFSRYQNSTSSTALTFSYFWWNAAGAIITGNTINVIASSTNTWLNTNGNFTAPSGAAYLTLYWQFDTSSSNRFFLIDGVVISPDSALATSYVEPSFPSVASLVSPFDKKINGYTLETTYSTTGLTFAGPLQTLYTCPAGSSSVVSTITATNLVSAATTFRLVVQKSGDSLASKHFIVFDQNIPALATEAYTIGITLSAGDILKVASDTSSVSFSAFGSEN